MMSFLHYIFIASLIFGQIIPPNCDPFSIGDGWYLARRTAATINPTWHMADDDLAV